MLSGVGTMAMPGLLWAAGCVGTLWAGVSGCRVGKHMRMSSDGASAQQCGVCCRQLCGREDVGPIAYCLVVPELKSSKDFTPAIQFKKETQEIKYKQS